ncbi:uncharacterized protein LOC119234363 isoform X3 [Talpa occidentalis]|uniref:uncharacterized protein LOC119234363 isoform X3 n=1 Tax=Talpa occidentalis TaxID=50954 RepID=UPI00188E495B|nr:uncharacterized protein LOC119234363 isoform X3 [Talpa occidentalis]
MAYTMLKVHEKWLLRLSGQGMQVFLYHTLAQPWSLPDDRVVSHLQASMAHLRRHGLDIPPPVPVMPVQPTTSEEPKDAGLCPELRLWSSEPSLPITPEVANRCPETVPFNALLSGSYPCALAWLIARPQPRPTAGALKSW